MRATRMIVCHSGQPKGSDQLKQQLSECGAKIAHSFQLINGVAADLSPEALRKFFAQFPGARVIPDRRRQIPPKPFGPDEWKEVQGPGDPGAPIGTTPENPEVSPLALALMKATDVNALAITGTGVKVCVVDSGVDFSHPDLEGVAVIGPDGKPLAADFTETDLTDTLGHGTAVAGCIAAQATQVYTIKDEQSGRPIAYTRIQGVAPGARIMSAKVFDSRVSSGFDSSIIAALEWAAANGADIINMSLGGTTLPNDGSDPMARAVESLRKQGILVVVAAGNDGGGIGTLSSPASSAGALSVGASTMYRSFAELGFLADAGKWTSDQLAAFSGRGPLADGRLKPELLAPGAFDWGLAPTAGSDEGQNFQLFGGTSQASPLMAGVACLVYQAFEKARGRFPTPDELVSIVCSTADDLGLPAYMQGAGRVNALRAVQAVMGQAQSITVSQPAPAVAEPGKQVEVAFDVTNVGTESATLPVKATTFEQLKGLSASFQGEIATPQPTQRLQFDVAPGVDLMHVSLDWPSEEHGPRSPRLLVALYDPKGRFVNYQRPNSAGDLELGKSVDTWVAHPDTGRWTAQVQLRLGARDTVQPFTLAIRAYRRVPWQWVGGDLESTLTLNPGESRRLALMLRVPEAAAAATHSGHIHVGGAVVPVSVVVPIALRRGQGSFGGHFQHGYQGDWGNGDWLYHQLPVAPGAKSLIASLQWPDVDNAVEFYLIDPDGQAVMGRSNASDAADDGDTDTRGGQVVFANPAPGTWRLALHSFAFSGRGMPEPYTGVVEMGGELVSPRMVQMRVGKGEQAPMAIYVRNPGRMPLTVEAVVQGAEPKLTWQSLAEQIKTGVSAEGKANGEGHIALSTVQVPYGARQIGVVLTWDQPDATLSVSMFDPISQGDRATATSSDGQLIVMASDPVAGEWTIMAGVNTPGVESRTVNLKGALFLVAPQRLDGVEARNVTVQPGASGVLPLTVQAPAEASVLAGQVVVTTAQGDRLGEVVFRIVAEEKAGDAGTDAAAAKT